MRSDPSGMNGATYACSIRGMARAPLFRLLLTLALAGCGDGSASSTAALATGGDASRGARLIRDKGCGSCHRIGGVPGATGMVGPSLRDLTSRAYIAGELTNTPENVVRWIMDPQALSPGTVMPDLGVTEAEARDIAAHLYGGQ